MAKPELRYGSVANVAGLLLCAVSIYAFSLLDGPEKNVV